MLIDGGSQKHEDAVLGVVREINQKNMDVVIGTHTDEDHIGGLVAIFQHYPVGAVYINGRTESRIYHILLKRVEAQGLPLQEALAGAIIPWEKDVEVRVFGPTQVHDGENSNDQSAIIQVRFGQHRFLFSGDAEKPAEEAVVQRYRGELQSTVYQVGHHGSSTSSSPAFVRAVAPQIAIVPVGPNSYHHPDALVLHRLALAGADVYSTEVNGTIRLRSDGQRLFLSTTKSETPLLKRKAVA